ncbi:GPW/gp25 family protein [Nocardioides gilvus]|uniref:GPW/gp25 family protein n=1 Tax=Nocardioides gilvus TaxID=1735589 RepID=UPI000D748AC7|nr:GPW/gp25 family protein [Nocardioides gilvus]
MELATTFGRGVAFPVGLSDGSRVALSQGPDNIATSLRIILSTEPGERVMLPAFGTGLRRYLYEPNVALTHHLIEEAVRRAVHRWEPRVRLDQVQVGADRDDPRTARIEVRYRLVATGAPGELSLAVPVAAGTVEGALR